MDTIRFATVGRSAITERFLEALAEVPGTSYEAAFSRRMETAISFAQAHGGVAGFDSIDKLAACDEIDAVYIGSPNALHAEQALKLMAGGKHVLVEKTFAANHALARDVFAFAGKQGLVALEGMRNVFGPGPEMLSELLPKVGTPRKATIRFSKITSRIKRLKEGKHVNIFDPHMAAGALMDIGIYCVEPAIMLFGMPDKIQTAALTHTMPPRTEDDLYTRIDLAGEVTLGYPGLLVGLSYGKISNDFLPSQIEGDKGTLTWRDTSAPASFSFMPHEDKGMIYGSATSDAAETFKVEPYENNMRYEIETFVDAIRGDEAALETVKRHRKLTLDSLSIVDEIRRQIGVDFPQDRRR